MNSTSIRLLKAMAEGKTGQPELMKILEIGEWQFNTITRELVNQDYIDKTDSTFSFKKNAKAALFHDITNQIDIEKLLHDSNEQIFFNLAEPTTIKDLQVSTGLSLRTLQRSISEFESVGVIKKDDGKISINKTRESLYLFAKLLKAENERKNIEPYAEVIYQDRFRVLKKVPKDKHVDGELTGFSLFTDYGIDYQTTHNYYIKQESSLRLEEILIHALLTANKNKDKNAITMTILFYLKNRDKMDPLEIRIIAKSYSISDVWIDIEGYVRNNSLKNPELFLPRNEFEEKARLYNIPPELYTLPVAYPQLFQDIGKTLSEDTEACLLGGENMRMKGLKDRTKDCDIIVSDDKALKNITKSLLAIDYKSLNKEYFTSDDHRIDPFDILEHPARSRIDLFKTRIAGKLVLSDKMIQRAKEERFGKFILKILSNEDVFLLKAVTLREGDIQDIAKIAQSGNFDWEIVWEELVYQEHLTRMNFSSLVLESMDYLYEQSSIRSPFYKKLIRRVLEHEISKLVRDQEMPLDGIIELLEGNDITEKMIRNRIGYLERKKHIKKIKKGDQVFIQAKEKIALNVYSNSPVDARERMKKHVERLSKDLALSDEVKKLALDLVDQVIARGIADGRKPTGLAAAIVYLSTIIKGEAYYTAERIAKLSNLSNPSMYALYKFVKLSLKL
ncbi:MAG: hypothetical protein KGI27_02265 [Thaumarchaeota archaeon]|nr:hypothetical protein [Nitrososphaerota archaeon]